MEAEKAYAKTQSYSDIREMINRVFCEFQEYNYYRANSAVGMPFCIGEFSGKCYNIMVNIVGFVFSVYINRKRFYRGGQTCLIKKDLKNM